MSFTLDSATLGTLGGLEGTTIETIVEDRGQGVTLDWSQTGFDQDFEIFGYGLRFHPAEQVPYDASANASLAAAIRTAYGAGLYGFGPYSGLTGSGSGSGIFILDVSTLGTLVASVFDLPIEERGRSIQIDWSQSGFDEDFELFGYGIRIAPAEKHAMEIP